MRVSSALLRCCRRTSPTVPASSGRALEERLSISSSSCSTCPERGFRLLVHRPNIFVLNGKHAEALGVVHKQGLILSGALSAFAHVVVDSARGSQVQ